MIIYEIELYIVFHFRFPNVVIANLSRNSVRAALSRGITAKQIIHYLNSHIHPEMLKHVSNLLHK